MGVLSDLILGSVDDIAAVPTGESPLERLGGIDIKGVDVVKLGVLHSLVTGQDFDPGLEAFPIVLGEESAEGPWVFVFPGELAAGLVALDSAEVKALGARWTATEEFQLDEWPEEEVQVVLSRIRECASQAIAQKRPIHLWTSL